MLSDSDSSITELVPDSIKLTIRSHNIYFNSSITLLNLIIPNFSTNLICRENEIHVSNWEIYVVQFLKLHALLVSEKIRGEIKFVGRSIGRKRERHSAGCSWPISRAFVLRGPGLSLPELRSK